MSTRDASFGTGIEIEIEWFCSARARIEGPAVSQTRSAAARTIAEANDRLVSRIAQQAAPRIATLMGKPPTFEARAPGQVAAGVNVPLEPAADPATATARPPRRPARRRQRRPSRRAAAAHVKVMVAPVTGAPSDGNRQLFSGMRRALGSSKIVVIDAAGADTFTVVGHGEADADRRQQRPARSSAGC